MFITAVPIIKLFAWGEGDSLSGGHHHHGATRDDEPRPVGTREEPGTFAGASPTRHRLLVHQPSGDREPTQARTVVFYYCSTYYKAVSVGGRG
jgi:hypothetical protein